MGGRSREAPPTMQKDALGPLHGNGAQNHHAELAVGEGNGDRWHSPRSVALPAGAPGGESPPHGNLQRRALHWETTARHAQGAHGAAPQNYDASELGGYKAHHPQFSVAEMAGATTSSPGETLPGRGQQAPMGEAGEPSR